MWGTPDFDTSITPGVYKISDTDGWLTSRNFWENKSTYHYGGHWDSPRPTPGGPTEAPNTAIASGDKIGELLGVDLTDVSNIPLPGDPDYKWTVTISESLLTNDPSNQLFPGMGLSDGDVIGVFWGGASCANDIIYGEMIVDLNDGGFGGFDPIPEPGTLLLFGFGLLGLAGYTIHRKKKKS
jgi:hypothetical protein